MLDMIANRFEPNDDETREVGYNTILSR